MRDLSQWIYTTFASGPAANQQWRANGIFGVMLDTITAKHANRGFLTARNRTERSIDDDHAQLFDSELGSARPPSAQDGTLIVDLETHPSAKPKTGSALTGEVVRNGRPFERARLIGDVVRDISRRTWPLRKAQLQVEELACANRRKDEFLAMLSHELRSPLASIHYGMGVMGRQVGNASTQQRMQALIERQLRRMTHLVDELLDVSRITSGRLHLQPERLDLRDVVSHAIETLEPDLAERNHRLSTALPDTPVWLDGDPSRLEQVFVNLLANASRYTDAGGELAVWIHTKDGQAVVRVRDSGIGIAPDALPHIFDLFKQAHEADPRSKAGLGVGLAVVRNLIELHGGSVTAGSAGTGRGSEFTVRLPLPAE
jgi:two-component system, sensor histidine kinase